MDTVLGVSMAPTAVRMVLVEGQNGEGATVDEDNFDVPPEDDAATLSAANRVVSAILGTRQGAAEGGYQLASTGVTFTDPIGAAALRDALAAHKVENVMLVSAFLAAAALAQAVGSQTNYAQTALLYIEPDTATLAVVNSADGSIVDVRRQPLPADDEAAVAQLATMVSHAETLETRPDGVFVVGSGIDIPLIKPALEAATSLPLSAPEEPETALARGAALASAHAPLFSSSTAALAYAQDPGTGAINPFALTLTPGYFDAAGNAGEEALAYSAVPDDIEDLYTGATALVDAGYPERQLVPAGGKHRGGRLRHRCGGAGRFLGDRHPAHGQRPAQPEPERRRRAHPARSGGPGARRGPGTGGSGPRSRGPGARARGPGTRRSPGSCGPRPNSGSGSPGACPDSGGAGSRTATPGGPHSGADPAADTGHRWTGHRRATRRRLWAARRR